MSESVALEVKTNFRAQLEAVKQHHLSGKRGLFFAGDAAIRPMAAMAAGVGGGTATIPDIVKPVTAAMAAGQQAVNDASTSGARDAANELKGSKNVDSFHDRLHTQEAQASKDAVDNIHAAYAQAEALGDDLSPEQQDAIVKGMDLANGAVREVGKLLSGALQEVESLVEDILKDIFGSVEEALGSFASEAGELLGGLL